MLRLLMRAIEAGYLDAVADWKRGQFVDGLKQDPVYVIITEAGLNFVRNFGDFEL